MSKKTKFVIAFFAVVISLFIIVNRCSREEFKNSSFQGVVTKIRYGDKEVPIVEIKHKEYVIPCRKGDLNIGDSLSKQKNSLFVKQYRKGEFIDEFEWWNR